MRWCKSCERSNSVSLCTSCPATKQQRRCPPPPSLSRSRNPDHILSPRTRSSQTRAFTYALLRLERDCAGRASDRDEQQRCVCVAADQSHCLPQDARGGGQLHSTGATKASTDTAEIVGIVHARHSDATELGKARPSAARRRACVVRASASGRQLQRPVRGRHNHRICPTVRVEWLRRLPTAGAPDHAANQSGNPRCGDRAGCRSVPAKDIVHGMVAGAFDVLRAQQELLAEANEAVARL